MTVRFNAEDHSYWADTRQVPSVTEILRAMGVYSDYAYAESHHRFRGSAVHAGAAMLDMGGAPKLGPVPAHLQQVADDIVNGYWPAFSAWKKATGYQGRIWECPFVDPVRGYGGCFDSVGECGDEVWMPDLKSGVLPEMVPVQLALYELLARNGIAVDEDHAGLGWLQEVIKSGRPIKRVAVRLSKDGRFTMFTQTTKAEDYSSPRWIAVASSILNVFAIRRQYGLLDKERGA